MPGWLKSERVPSKKWHNRVINPILLEENLA